MNGRRNYMVPPVMARAFTLVELLVVMVLIALLTGLILPSLRASIRQARSTVCQANLHQLYQALEMYRGSNDGWLPVSGSPSLRSATSWSTAAFETFPAGRTSLICPSDTWASTMRRSMFSAPYLELSSYGMNDFIVSSPNAVLANLDRRQPTRPADTLLLADMGPDTIPPADLLGAEGSPVADRQYQRQTANILTIDDGYRAGAPQEDQGEPWLTPRHSGRINVLTVAGHIRSIDTHPALSRTIAPWYPHCAAQFCTLCVDLELAHYSFAESRSFWWTGPVPML